MNKMNNLKESVAYLATNPWIFLNAYLPVIAIGAGFTRPNSPGRFAVFTMLSIYAWLCIANFSTYIESPTFLASVHAGTIFGSLLIYFDRLIYRKATYEERREIFPVRLTGCAKQSGLMAGAVPEDRDTLGSRFTFGLAIAGTFRGPGTLWEIKNLPPFSSSDPQWVPSPIVFVIWRLAVIISCFVLNEYVTDVRMALDYNLMLPSSVPFFFRIKEIRKEECWVRLIVGVSTWFSAYCGLQILFTCPALISVCAKPSDVALWRPVFGSILDAYTIRGFWGKFWHQNLQLNFQGTARFVTHSVLRLPRTGLIQRYTFVFLVFFVSGCFHVVYDLGAGIPPSQSGALRFFITQVPGIMLEDGVQEMYRRARRGREPAPWSRILGYVWVLAFLSWSTACWQYPALTKGTNFNVNVFRSSVSPRDEMSVRKGSLF